MRKILLRLINSVPLQEYQYDVYDCMDIAITLFIALFKAGYKPLLVYGYNHHNNKCHLWLRIKHYHIDTNRTINTYSNMKVRYENQIRVSSLNDLLMMNYNRQWNAEDTIKRYINK